MKTQKILDNFRKLPVLTGRSVEANDVLLAMFRVQLGAGHEEDLLSLVPNHVFEVRTVYSLGVGNQHSCSLYLLCADDAPLTFYGYHGFEDDAHPEVNVVDLDKARALAEAVALGLARRRLAQYNKDLREVDKDLFYMGGNQFLTQLSDSTFGVDALKDVVQDSLLREPFRAMVYVNGEFEQIEALKMRDTDEGRFAFAQTANGEREVHQGKLVFQFLSNESELREARERFCKNGDWFICARDTSEAARMVTAYIRAPETWSYAMALITFRTVREFNGFMEGNVLDRMVDGAFPWEKLPDGASVVGGDF